MAREFMPDQDGQVPCDNLERFYWLTERKSFVLSMDTEYAPDLTMPRALHLRDTIQARLRDPRPMKWNTRAALQNHLWALNIFLGGSVVDQVAMLVEGA
jgi:hypothetical protein